MSVGIENIKTLSLIPVSLAMIAEDALKDGKLGFGDALAHGPSLVKLVNGLIGFNFAQVLVEFKDLSDVEKEDWKIFVQKELDLENDVLEVQAEKMFGIAVEAAAFISKALEFIKSLKK